MAAEAAPRAALDAAALRRLPRPGAGAGAFASKSEFLP